jgi:hypothetical protein
MTLEASERTKVEGNAVGVKQGHRAGTGTVHGQSKAKTVRIKSRRTAATVQRPAAFRKTQLDLITV